MARVLLITGTEVGRVLALQLSKAGHTVVRAETAAQSISTGACVTYDHVVVDALFSRPSCYEFLDVLTAQYCVFTCLVKDAPSVTGTSVGRHNDAGDGEAVVARSLDTAFVDLLAGFADPTTVSSRVRDSLAALERRHGESRLTLQLIARDVGVSREHLSRLLKRATGRTFLTHLNAIRLREVKRLLDTTSLSIKEIAGVTGFSGSACLARCFRRVNRLSPTLYRRRPQQ